MNKEHVVSEHSCTIICCCENTVLLYVVLQTTVTSCQCHVYEECDVKLLKCLGGICMSVAGGHM